MKVMFDLYYLLHITRYALFIIVFCQLFCPNVLQAQTRSEPEPSWVRNPYTAYPSDRYIAAVGSASNRTDAEKKALANLVSIFGMSIQSDFSILELYSEAVSKGIVEVSDNINIRDSIITAASFDTLIGAQTANAWDDGRGLIYTIAFMDRAKTVDVYSEMIRVNNRNIENLTAMSPAEKNTFDAYARYKLAAVISGINAKYANVVFLAGGPQVSSWNLASENSLNYEASEIIKNITVTVIVDNDRNNQIRDAFSRALGSEGLRTRGNNPPYTLEVSIYLNEVVFPNSNYKYCGYTVHAELIDNATNSVLFPYSFTDREPHRTYALAVSSAFTWMERKIDEQFPVVLKDYLAALLPQR